MLFFGWYNEIKSTQVLNLDSLKPKKKKRAFHVGFKIGTIQRIGKIERFKTFEIRSRFSWGRTMMFSNFYFNSLSFRFIQLKSFP